MPRLDDRTVKELQQKRDRLDEKIAAKQQEKQRAIGTFVQALEKELAASKQRDYRKEEEFKSEVQKFGEFHKQVLTDLVEAKDRLKLAKDGLVLFLKQEKAERL